MKNYKKEIAKLSFEQALQRLEEVVEKLSSQKVDLDNMIELHQEGNALKEHCQNQLNEAKLKIENINKEES